MDECASKLSDAGKEWFRNLGSREINKLKYRQSWAFIGIKGRNLSYEKRGINIGQKVGLNKVFHVTK